MGGGKEKLIHDGYGYHISKKGYPRFNNCGPMRGQYIHRYEMAKKLGRPLKKDEQVHHGPGGKKDFSHGNLSVIGQREHGWVSAKQAFYMKLLDIKAEKEFYAAVEQLQQEGVAIAI